MTHALFIAQIRSRRHRGETLFSVAIILAGQRRVFSIADLPTLQAARLEALDWAHRHGKTDSLQWHYRE